MISYRIFTVRGGNMIKTEYEVYYQLREDVAEKLQVHSLIKITVRLMECE